MLNPSIFQVSIEFPWKIITIFPFYHHFSSLSMVLFPWFYHHFSCSSMKTIQPSPHLQPPGARVQNLTKPSLPKPPESSKTMPKPLRGTLGSAESWDSKTGFQNGIFLEFSPISWWFNLIILGFDRYFKDGDIWGSMGINNWIYPVI